MLFTSKHNAGHMEYISLSVGDMVILSTTDMRSLGVLFDSKMTMEQQVNRISRSSYAELRNIGHIRCYLTSNA